LLNIRSVFSTPLVSVVEGFNRTRDVQTRPEQIRRSDRRRPKFGKMKISSLHYFRSNHS